MLRGQGLEMNFLRVSAITNNLAILQIKNKKSDFCQLKLS